MAAYTDVKPLITDTMTESISQLLLRTKAASVTTGPGTPCPPGQPTPARVGRPEPSGQPGTEPPQAWMGEGALGQPARCQVMVPKPCCDLVAPRCPHKPWGPQSWSRRCLCSSLCWASVCSGPGRWLVSPTRAGQPGPYSPPATEASRRRRGPGVPHPLAGTPSLPPPCPLPLPRPQALTAEDAPLHLDTRSLPQLST